MKKQITVILCCLALIISSMAQTKTEITPQFSEKSKPEILHKKINSEKGKMILFNQNTSLSVNAKSQRNADWWEPDTIHGYYLDGTAERRIFSYQNANCTVDLTQSKINYQWLNASQVLYSYDFQNNRTEELEQVWKSEEWVNTFHCFYNYDSKNNMTECLEQTWTSGQWVNAWHGIFEYDLQNNLTEETWQSWASSQWENDEKKINSYDTYNNLKECIYQYWDGTQWINVSNEIYTYNAQNNYTEILIQLWENTQWKDYALQTFTYNEQNQCTINLIQLWNNGQWVNEDKISSTYDSQNNQTSEMWETWWDNQWKKENKTTCSYDDNNNATSGYCQYWAGDTWVDVDAWSFVFYNNMQSLAFINGFRFTASYIDPYNVNIKENSLLDNSIKLYPNPVSDILHIDNNNLNEIPNVQIYSIQGTLLMNVQGNQIDVSSLLNGIYIAVIDGVNRKIIKQ